MSDYRTEAPEILRDFLSYHETIKAHSQRTVDEYYLDLRNFFRYMKQILQLIRSLLRFGKKTLFDKFQLQ